MPNTYKKDGDIFHKKITRLFKLMAEREEDVEHRPHQEGPDIIAKIMGKKIIIQCKFSKKQKLYSGLQALIKEYQTRRKEEKADIVILAFSGYRIPEIEHSVKLNAIKDEIVIWRDENINIYYELASAIGEYASYQLLGDLNLMSPKNKTISFPAFSIKQHNITYYVFKTTASKILPLTYVARRSSNKSTYQRMLNKKRVKTEIPEYINKKTSLIPNSIILVSDNKLTFSNGKITLKNINASLQVLDGQHRLYSFVNANPINLENYELIFVLIDGETNNFGADHRASLFTTINQKAKSVPSKLLLDLAMHFNNVKFFDDYMIHLIKLLEKSSVFNNLFVSYGDNHKGIELISFCSEPALKILTNPNDGLIKGKVRKVMSTKQHTEYVGKKIILFFSLIKRNFPEQWGRPSEYILSTTRGSLALLYLLIHIIKYNNNIFPSNEDLNNFIVQLKKALRDMSNLKIKNFEEFSGAGGVSKITEMFKILIANNIPGFVSNEQNISSTIDEFQVSRGDSESIIKEKIRGWTKKYFLPDETVYANLMHIDNSTFEYFRDLFPNSKNFIICFQDIKTADKPLLKTTIQSIKSHQKSVTLHKVSTHERWIATERYQIQLNTDFKRDALTNNNHLKSLLELGKDSKLIEIFNAEIKTAKRVGGKDYRFNYDINE